MNTTNTVGSVESELRQELREMFVEYLAKHDEGYDISFVPDVFVEKIKPVIQQQAKAEERERLRRLVCPCACDMFIDEDGYEEAHRGDMEALNQT